MAVVKETVSVHEFEDGLCDVYHNEWHDRNWLPETYLTLADGTRFNEYTDKTLAEDVSLAYGIKLAKRKAEEFGCEMVFE